ncbi:gamma-aminobutyric acid receptor alpha-like [Elysia marginata]|uniref:Gamma-aminobutyric acid receptor alpha-like n=1 Tax=Elysia marginata TaxID=1093978 RepID=A0AAV4EZX4_9GAST|nr:gamma-aminobutyric acid receptor alpha-like [Elysia marginata]
MDCYFRQNWVDRRLAFNATEEQVSKVSLNLKMLERIWHPDTYFINGGPSYVHTITTPNKLTIKATCPMHLEKFPMDSQLCPLHIASFGYPASDVVYEWHYGNALAAVASNDMRLSQFDLKGMPASNSTKSFKGSATTMLTMTFLVLDSRNDLPRVAYSTALDVYVALCFFFVFASIVQFAAVHFFTKYGTADSDFKSSVLSNTDSDTDVRGRKSGTFRSVLLLP